MPKRRGHGEGSIVQRCRTCPKHPAFQDPDGRGPRCPQCEGKDGYWQGSIMVGRRPDGKPDRRNATGATRREVSSQLAAFKSDADKRQLPAPGRTTVGAWLQEYVDDPTKDWRESTRASYRRMIRLHTGPVSDILLSKVTALDLKRLYADRLAAGLSRRTVEYLHAILSGALDEARRLTKQLVTNPAEDVKPPRPDPREARALTPDERGAVLAAARTDRLFALYVLALATGMREGELLGLRWSDVDWRNKLVRVRQIAATIDNRVMLLPNAKYHSNRDISIGEATVAELLKYRSRQADERALAGPAWSEHNLVFPSVTGTPINASNLLKQVKRLYRAAGIPISPEPDGADFHSLRHTHATDLMEAGVPLKVISERLGHKDPAFTARVYQHVRVKVRQDVAALADSLLFGPARETRQAASDKVIPIKRKR